MKERNIEIAKMLGWVYIPESDKSSFVYAERTIGRNQVTEKNVVETHHCELFVKNPQERDSIKLYDYKVYDVEEYSYQLEFDKDWNLLMKAVEFIEAQPEVVVDCQKDFLNDCFFSRVLCKNVKGHFCYHTAQTRMEAIFETVHEYAKELNNPHKTAAINIIIIQ